MPNHIFIRRESPADCEAISRITYEAFLNHPQHEPGAQPTEHKIVDALRAAGALTLSLICDDGEEILAHIAFSPVTINGKDCGWYGLGPVSVRPDRQGQGLGSALIRSGIRHMKEKGAKGIVLVGEPGYYSRFGFAACVGLVLDHVPPEYFMYVLLSSDVPSGSLEFHPAFVAS